MSDRSPASEDRRHAIGVMMGTSIDGIDAALVEGTGRGDGLCVKLIDHCSIELGPLAAELRAVAEQTPRSATELAWLASTIATHQIAAIERVWRGDEPAHVIALHGQTVAHAPPTSWQLVEPAIVVARFEVPVITDLRQADLAAGGEGAPITPRADWVLFADTTRRRAIVNLGGFCNITIVPPRSDGIDGLDGFDVCVCNQLLDRIARVAIGAPFDAGGETAARGTISETAAATLIAELTAAALAGRSFGPGDETTGWLDEYGTRLSAPDLAATASAAIARVIADRIRDAEVEEVILAGGGARHAPLRAAIASGVAMPVVTTEACGIPVDTRESVAMATLGLLALDGIPPTVPRITHASRLAASAGRWSMPTSYVPVKVRTADGACLRGDA